MNPRPLGPEPSALPNCATPRTVNIISNRTHFCKRFPCVNLSHMTSLAVSGEEQLSLRLQKAHSVRDREDLQLSACCRPVPEEGGEHPRKLSFLFRAQREIVFCFREGIADRKIASRVGKKERRIKSARPAAQLFRPAAAVLDRKIVHVARYCVRAVHPDDDIALHDMPPENGYRKPRSAGAGEGPKNDPRRACKPGSVERGHLSTPAVTDGLKRYSRLCSDGQPI